MGDDTPARYDPHAIEARRQAAWRESDAFLTPAAADGRPHKYIKASSPFTSGNIHIGHVRSYAIGDAYARFLRARGDAVLFAFGWDAFGLPAELGAIEAGVSPSAWVHRCAEHMTGQLQRLGFCFDFERTFFSSDAIMYRWSQWLFLTFLEAGLIYQGTASVDWCDHCETTLATIQVEDGVCWRCHGPVRLIQRAQWYLRISAYLEENDRRLAELKHWDELSLASQRIVLGRLDGVEVDLRSPDGRVLTAFTAHTSALTDARFVLISPRHPDVDSWATDASVAERLEEMRSGGWERSEREAEAVQVIDTGHTVLGLSGAELPVLVSPVVDSRFGVTTVLGIPEHDRTDEVIARRFDLLESDAGVESGARGDDVDAGAQAGVESGAQASGDAGAQAGGESGAQADAPTQPTVRPAVRYRAHDFSISRQRSWGTPIPIVYCEHCGTVPVPLEQLPVTLPLDLKPAATGNPLAESAEFVQVACPSCGAPGRRETDTLDCHFDSLWLWIPSCLAPATREESMQDIFQSPDLRRWLPSERLVAGSDSGNFMFDQRITTKALRDIGPLAFMPDGEPFAGALMHEMVISGGRKMSKHLGNVVDPDELISAFGADTVRLAVLYAARPQRSLNWSDSAVRHSHRFLTNLWEYAQARFAINRSELDSDAPEDTEHLRARLVKWCDAAAQRTTEDLSNLEMHSAVRNVMRLFERVKDYESRVIARRGALGSEDHEALLSALALLAALLTPFAPHAGEELWIASGHSVTEAGASPAGATAVPWPGVSAQSAKVPA